MNRLSRLSLAAAAGVAAAVAPTALAHSNQAAAATVTVTAAQPSEFAFKLSTKAVAHGAVTFKVTNGSKAGLPHDFEICSLPAKSTAAATLPTTCGGKKTPLLNQNATATLKVVIAKPGNYEYLCTVPGHAAGGMKGILKVT